VTSTLTGLGEATRVEKERSVKFEWHVRTVPAGENLDGTKVEHGGGYGERKVLAVLTVMHHKAGANYFSGEMTTEDYFDASLCNETEERSRGFVSRGFMLFSGLRVARYGAGNRFSRKKLNEAADRALAEFVALYESGNEQVMAYFEGRG
jgi:hypothetical protein